MELWPINTERAREITPFFIENFAAWLSLLLLFANFRFSSRLRAHFFGLLPPKKIGIVKEESEKKPARFTRRVEPC
jgi:hypothetical protein